MVEIINEELLMENINPLVKEYESLLATLKEELECYKAEQTYLRSEIVTLLEENKLLSTYIRTHIQKSGTPEIKDKYDESDIVQNLKSQIEHLNREKNSTSDLWKTALERIDQLEDELRLHEGGTHGYVSKIEVEKMKEKYHEQIKDLEMVLMQSKVHLLESQKSTKSVIDLKTGELKQLTENHQNTMKAVENLQGNIQRLQIENQNLHQERNKLTQTVSEKNNLISGLRVKEKESQTKVAEAIQIVEAAFIEKDASLLREQQAKDEMIQLTKAYSDAMEEANKKLQIDLELAKKQYLEKAQKLKTDMKSLAEFLKKKDLELEKQRDMAKILEDKLDLVRKGNLSIEDSNTSKLLILEKNLESTFQKLLLTEKKNIQLEADKISIKEDLDQMANLYERDNKMKETEKRVLQNKITALQNDLDISNSGLMQVASKVEDVNSKLLIIETELKKQLHMKDVKNEKILTNKIKEIEIANDKLNRNVKQRLQTQIEFNKKWKVTVNDIIEKLEKRVLKLKQEGSMLKKMNRELTSKLRESEQHMIIYKERLKSLCLDVTKVASFSKEHLIEKGSNIKLTDSGIDNAAN